MSFYFCLQRLHPLRNDVHRQREHYRGIFLHSNFHQRLQITQLDRRRFLLQHGRGLGQLGRRLKFAFGGDDLGAALALRLGLPGDGALHILRDIYLLHLNLGYLDTPRLGILVKDLLQLGVNLFALRKDGVQFELSDQAAQRGLRQLRSSI